jgi:hypothetical protein
MVSNRSVYSEQKGKTVPIEMGESTQPHNQQVGVDPSGGMGPVSGPSPHGQQMVQIVHLPTRTHRQLHQEPLELNHAEENQSTATETQYLNRRYQ